MMSQYFSILVLYKHYSGLRQPGELKLALRLPPEESGAHKDTIEGGSLQGDELVPEKEQALER